jgi:putative OPT family oligopeptide transporter
MAEHKPLVPAESKDPELTVKAVLAGIAMAALFGAANAYLGIKAGQTVAATIPAAVLAIALFRLPFFKGTVLEQNIARTAGSVGEALVAGAIFVLPAFVMVEMDGQRIWPNFRSNYWEGVLILLAGGLLGVFLIILLRRPLCVDAGLPFPESVATYEVVKTGQGGENAARDTRTLFGALGAAALLQFFKSEQGFQVFKESVSGILRFPRSVLSHFDFSKQPIGQVQHTGAISYATPAASPALIGVGYIIGPRLATINFTGGVIAWWVLIPLVLFIDPDLPTRLRGSGTTPAALDVVAYSVWYNVVRPIAVGAMLVGAVNTMWKMRESLLSSLKGALASSREMHGGRALSRLDQDIPLPWTLTAIAVLTVPIAGLYYHFLDSLGIAAMLAVVMVAVAFFLSAVGGYLVGLVGSSNQPLSGLTLSALILSAVVLVGLGVRGIHGVAAVLGVAAVVSCACSVSGSLIQDLKAGHLLGGTPWKMELVEVLAVAVLSLFLLLPMIALHEANIAGGGIGIGGKELPAPQAGLMAALAKGIVGGQMAWGLIFMGVAFGIALVMMDAPSPMLIAVGMYLPLETTSAIFLGGMMKWAGDRLIARRNLAQAARDQYENKGMLLASGFIAGEAITGVLLAVLVQVFNKPVVELLTGKPALPFLDAWGGWLSLIAFAIIAWTLTVQAGRITPALPAPASSPGSDGSGKP